MLAVLSILGMIALDQAVKYWAVQVLEPLGDIPLLEGIFHLTYVENRGSAFGLFLNQRMLFMILTPVVLAVIAFALWRRVIQTKLGKWSLYLLFGGAVGNFIDRMLRGYVVDLFYFKLIDFPVFNVADVFICSGAALFFIYFQFQHQTPENKKEVKSDA